MKPSILKLTELYAFYVFSKKIPSTYYYHSWQHTLSVVKSCKILAQKMGLSAGQIELLAVAAYLHDVGYALSVDEHEAAGVVMAKRFLAHNDYDFKNIQEVADCIASTTAGCCPQNILQQILCDADLCSLGSETGFLWSKRLRSERETLLGKTYSDVEWLQLNIHFYENHQYHTPAARQLYEAIKQNNLEKMKRLSEIVEIDAVAKQN